MKTTRALGIAALIIGSVADAAPPPQTPPANNRQPPVKNAQPRGPSERRKAELQATLKEHKRLVREHNLRQRMATFYSDRAIVQENQMLGAMARTIPAQSVASPPGNPYPGFANATQSNLRTLGFWTITPDFTLPFLPPTNSHPVVGGNFINSSINNTPGR